MLSGSPLQVSIDEVGEAEIIRSWLTRGHASRGWRREKLNAKIRRLLRDLQSSLSKALAESSEVSDVLDRIREEGWSLYLVVDRNAEETDEPQEAFELTASCPIPEGADPVFKIDGRDLLFLKSVGIDPTRKLRKRRGE
jgi:hypothetical protein